MGAIIRTSAKNKKEDQIISDVEQLLQEWERINKKIEESNDFPQLVYKSKSITQKIILDMIDKGIDTIWVNTKKIQNEIEEILEKLKIEKKPEIKKEDNLMQKYDIEKQLEKLSKRKIWLKCGGFITIDRTEALTAVDVNTGKYIGKENYQKTVFTVNKEATEEIAKQLKLRDLDGIIIIDYIDMNEENSQKILSILKEILKQDRSKTQVLGFTRLNLLEMTRKHMYSSIEEK